MVFGLFTAPNSPLSAALTTYLLIEIFRSCWLVYRIMSVRHINCIISLSTFLQILKLNLSGCAATMGFRT